MQPAQENSLPRAHRILMAGPLPPAVGGMATVIEDIGRSSLARQVDLVLFDTAKQTPPGRTLWQAFIMRYRIWRRWWRLLEPASRTIAHIHTCSGLTFFLDSTLVLLARLRGAPAVLHIHGARFEQFLDRLPRPLRYLARWLARRASAVVVLSEEWKQKLAGRLPGARLAIIPNGVAEPPSGRAAAQPGAITMLFLGNLSRRKGVWDLIPAMANLDPRCRLVLVGGEEDPGIRAALESEIRRLGLEARVHLAGAAVGEEKYRWLSTADIFVLPSYAEGVPISMLEAMAAGLPVIVTPVGGIGSVITDGENGLLVAPGNREQLHRAMQRLADDEALRQRLGSQAKMDCLEKYGVEHSVSAYLDLYNNLGPDQRCAVSPHAQRSDRG